MLTLLLTLASVVQVPPGYCLTLTQTLAFTLITDCKPVPYPTSSPNTNLALNPYFKAELKSLPDPLRCQECASEHSYVIGKYDDQFDLVSGLTLVTNLRFSSTTCLGLSAAWSPDPP